MELSDWDRKQIGAAVRQERIRVFGTKSAAYQKAGLNSATWDRIEAGGVVRDDRLTAAVKALWPYTGGNLEHMPYFAGRVGNEGLASPAEIGDLLDELVARVNAAEARLDRLEASSEEAGDSGGDVAVPDQKSDEENVRTFPKRERMQKETEPLKRVSRDDSEYSRKLAQERKRDEAVGEGSQDDGNWDPA